MLSRSIQKTGQPRTAANESLGTENATRAAGFQTVLANPETASRDAVLAARAAVRRISIQPARAGAACARPRFRLAPRRRRILNTDVAAATPGSRRPDRDGRESGPTAAVSVGGAGLSPVAAGMEPSLTGSRNTELMVCRRAVALLRGNRRGDAAYRGRLPGIGVGEHEFAYKPRFFTANRPTPRLGVADRPTRHTGFREPGGRNSIVADANAWHQVGPLQVPRLTAKVRRSSRRISWASLQRHERKRLERRGRGNCGVESGSKAPAAPSDLVEPAGGYQTFVSPGVYTVTAYGGSLPSPMVIHDVVIGGANVKVDFEYDPAEHATPLVDLNGPGEAGSDFHTAYFEGWGAVPIAAAAATLENSYGDRPILTLTATITTPSTRKRSGGRHDGRAASWPTSTRRRGTHPEWLGVRRVYQQVLRTPRLRPHLWERSELIRRGRSRYVAIQRHSQQFRPPPRRSHRRPDAAGGVGRRLRAEETFRRAARLTAYGVATPRRSGGRSPWSSRPATIQPVRERIIMRSARQSCLPRARPFKRSACR